MNRVSGTVVAGLALLALLIASAASHSVPDGGDPCDNHPCQHCGTCISKPCGSYYCLCEPEYTGHHCETFNNPCDCGPCKNGGTCWLTSPTDYMCTCPPGYSGDTCEIAANPCHPNPCQHGGLCSVHSPLLHSCTCSQDYTGDNCEIYIDPCDFEPCQNGGTCTRLSATSYHCSCPPDYTGTYCELYVNPCDDMPCQNAGTCTRTSATTYLCECPPEYSGPQCQYLTCSSLVCMYGGTCVVQGGIEVCLCPPAFTGTLCELDTGACLAANHHLLDEEWRQPSVPLSTPPKCDNLLPDGWYRFQIATVDATIPTSCVAESSCSTRRPIWLDMTSHPGPGEEVSVTGCDHFQGDCCRKPIEGLRVRGCSTFTIYYLTKPDTCNQVYCAQVA